MAKKSLITLILVVLVTFGSYAANNVNKSNLFRDAKMKEISEMARKERKPIMIYVGSDNCLESLKMDEILDKKEVVSYLKSAYICKNLNIGNLGDQFIATNYGATKVPCFIYINGFGEVVHITTGFKKSENMIEEAKKALTMMIDQNGRRI